MAKKPPHLRTHPGAVQFDALSLAVAERDRDTMAMVDHAVRTNAVFLVFQPVIQTARPDRVAFHEALIRVQDQTGRTIPAADFIDAIEAHEIGRTIDCHALAMGLTALSENPALRLSVNMSARSIGFRRWMQTLEDGLRSNPTIAERLILEITESSAIVMPDVTRAFMGEMQDHGISFALDDFGAGYTAFRYFKEFVFDILKIDGQFIRGIATDPDNRALTEALISVGRHFEMFTVAESVESAQDAACLTEIGVDCMQGYHFGAPTRQPVWPEKINKNKAV